MSSPAPRSSRLTLILSSTVTPDTGTGTSAEPPPDTSTRNRIIARCACKHLVHSQPGLQAVLIGDRVACGHHARAGDWPGILIIGHDKGCLRLGQDSQRRTHHRARGFAYGQHEQTPLGQAELMRVQSARCRRRRVRRGHRRQKRPRAFGPDSGRLVA